MVRVMTVFGTRPEAIKLAPVIQELEKDPHFKSIVVATAQHREMLDQVLRLFNIKPDRDLNLMRKNQDLASLTASIFTHLDSVLESLKPDWLLVQGDTTTVMAAALNAYYRHIKIGHVEAGLRTGNKWQPFPEEINRQIASVVADLHFAPTEWARDNLLRENINDNQIKVTGNTIIDALQQITKLSTPQEITTFLTKKGILSGKKRLLFITAHRRENFGEPIQQICTALKALASKYQDTLEIIYPVHMNPNITQPVHELLGGISNISLLPPQEYLSQIQLLKHAYMILTDSGGIQEEATGLGIPCLILREVTERPEGIEAGVLKLVGTAVEDIISESENLLNNQSVYQAMSHAANPYGDGTAAKKIIGYLK
ncbi:MAG: UDP-N-acetylglucosamine 2-epimerase (non-hydrolyzing) [Anaerolineaceae bacterium]|nr:UDP-N-acetylglucosamine 2-epimerase (non-hydrolyzing) [Anaerolineaceae bacterium]